MAQLLLFNTHIAVDVMQPTPTGEIEIIFKEYEPFEDPGRGKEWKATPTGRAWSGMMTDRALFDCLTSAGLVKPDVFEIGTGIRNEPLARKRR